MGKRLQKKCGLRPKPISFFQLLIGSQSGLTIIEIMIAVFLLGMVMISVINSTSTSFEMRDATVKINKENLSIETAMDRISWDIEHQYSPLFFSRVFRSQSPGTDSSDSSSSSGGVISGDTAENSGINSLLAPYSNNENFSGPSEYALPIPIIKSEDKNELHFFTVANRRKVVDSKASHFAWVKYKLEKDEANSAEKKSNEQQDFPNLVRYQFSANPFLKETIQWDKIRPQILLRNVKKLQFLYWDEIKKKFVENMNELKSNEKYFRGIKIVIEYVDASNVERLNERIFRPLFPYFEPEDLGALLKSGNTSSGSLDENNSETEEGPEDEEEDEEEISEGV
jgi:hypothetical protein